MWRKHLCRVLTAVVWLQSLVPVGFMPSTSQAGMPTLELCGSVPMPTGTAVAATAHHDHARMHAGMSAVADMPDMAGGSADVAPAGHDGDHGESAFAHRKFCAFSSAAQLAAVISCPPPSPGAKPIHCIFVALPAEPELPLPLPLAAAHQFARGPPT